MDLLATMRAGLALVKNGGKITQGASTITQQVIKNTYLTQEQTFTRKITEILLAPEVEKQYSKADIMEFYCNTNFYGNRCYGVEAASRYYFNKSAADLEVWEAATLVGISNSPGRYDPVKNPEDSKEKRNSVLKSMLEMEYISDDLYNIAIAQPLTITEVQQEGTDENYMVSYAIHCAALELMKADFFEFRYTFMRSMKKPIMTSLLKSEVVDTRFTLHLTRICRALYSKRLILDLQGLQRCRTMVNMLCRVQAW